MLKKLCLINEFVCKEIGKEFGKEIGKDCETACRRAKKKQVVLFPTCYLWVSKKFWTDFEAILDNF